MATEAEIYAGIAGKVAAAIAVLPSSVVRLSSFVNGAPPSELHADDLYVDAMINRDPPIRLSAGSPYAQEILGTIEIMFYVPRGTGFETVTGYADLARSVFGASVSLGARDEIRFGSQTTSGRDILWSTSAGELEDTHGIGVLVVPFQIFHYTTGTGDA